MDNINWLKQTDKPLFEDVLWSRPENRRHAGKLLIIGGHAQSFSAVAAAYAAAGKAGIGTSRVMVPDALEKLLGRAFPEAEFGASTPIGSFSRQALAQLLDSSDWADGVLLAGDFGRNSETAILLESFAAKYTGQLGLAGDAVDYFAAKSQGLLQRQNTLIVASPGQLQKLAQPDFALKQNADLAGLVTQLAAWSATIKAVIITKHQNQLIVAANQQISTTAVKGSVNLTDVAAYASVWLLQQPTKPFEALTTAAYCL